MNTKDRLADLSGATVTVTGGFGLVGSRIVHKLRALGAKPLAVGRLDAYGSALYSSVFEISPRDPDVIAGDITDAALMDDLLSHSDYVIHAASEPGLRHTERRRGPRPRPGPGRQGRGGRGPGGADRGRGRTPPRRPDLRRA